MRLRTFKLCEAPYRALFLCIFPLTENDSNFSMNLEGLKDLSANNGSSDDPSPRPDAESKLVPEMMPCGHRMNGRNLIVCIDGTSNQFGERNTNVIEMYNIILKEATDNQRTWYNSGIGTYARPSWKSWKHYKKVLFHKVDLAIAWDFERTVSGAYRWLSDNYQQGDCIFLFGFSRGAFQVRALSAMIDKVGLIYKGNEMQIPFAYELYADPRSDVVEVTQVGSQETMTMAERFKRAFSHKNVKVHFVGAWDTVSSIGIMRGTHMLPRTIEGMTHVCYFRHALALDERRVKFQPEYAYGGKSNPPFKLDDKSTSPVSQEFRESLDKGNSPSTENGCSPNAENQFPGNLLRKNSTGKHPHMLEVWFAGTHSDIGGGNVRNAGMDRSRPPLRWMVFEAGAVGLRTARFERGLSSDEQIDIKESLTWFWWPLEVIPIKRLTFTRRENGKPTTYKPHLGSGRKIHPGQKIHSSLLLANKTLAEYTPKARPLNDDGSFWQSLLSKGLSGLSGGTSDGLPEWLELDLYEYTEKVVASIVAGVHGIALSTLRQIAISRDGRQAVYEQMIKRLTVASTTEQKHQLLCSATDVLGTGSQDGSDLQLRPSLEVLPLLSDLWSNEKHQKTAQEFLMRFTDRNNVRVNDLLSLPLGNVVGRSHSFELHRGLEGLAAQFVQQACALGPNSARAL